MDIVYTLSNNYAGEELRYSLRSLQNLPHGKVFFVGGCPKWAKGVIHIPTVQKGTKYKNTTGNLITACNDSRISANFILMNDDFFVLDKVLDPVKELNLDNGTTEKVLERYNRLVPMGSPYIAGMKTTDEFVKRIGIENPLNYELHIPFIINKKKFLKMFELPGVETIKCFHKRTVYGNLYVKGSISVEDVKIFIKDKFDPNNWGKFLSCDDMGFYRLLDFIRSKFPEKSEYEI